MATFVLVHGGWLGGWCWKKVRASLQKRGHNVFTPTLTGLADRSHIHVTADLEMNINDVANLIQWEDLDDVVLCGHSGAGVVVGCVADRLPEKVKSIVYLDGYIPVNGKSIMDMIPRAHADLFNSLASNGSIPPLPIEVWNIVSEEDCQWVSRLLTPQPLAPYEQKIVLTGRPIKHIRYVAAEWEGSPFLAYAEEARRLGWPTTVLKCGHNIMVDLPEDVVAELELAAGI